jgi:hypothetical protein
VDAVALFRAEAGTRPSGTGSFSYFTNFLLLVDNLALAKQVRILDMMPALVPGAFIRAVSGSSVPGNGEISVWAHFADDGFRHDAARRSYGPYLTLQLARAFLFTGQLCCMDQCLLGVVGDAGFARVQRTSGKWCKASGSFRRDQDRKITEDRIRSKAKKLDTRVAKTPWTNSRKFGP